MEKALLIFPHQLFERHAGLDHTPDLIVLIEDSLFFNDHQYPVNFHRQKRILHRASMRHYADSLRQQGYNCDYHEWCPNRLEQTAEELQNYQLIVSDPTDYALTKRLQKAASKYSLAITWLENQLFINTPTDNQHYRNQRKRWFMADFYQHQRRKLDILIENGKPTGGRWSFDDDNRKKIPLKERAHIPNLPAALATPYVAEAEDYIDRQFPDAPGTKNSPFIYPTTHAQAREWLAVFLQQRFKLFGTYEDALVPQQSWLYHSVLTPAMNIGLLTPGEVVRQALDFAKENDIPINSVEGFVRQIIGWREFMRATYEDLGVTMRNSNHWQHHNALPAGFYDASTGITPLDDVITRVLQTGYCHHIERLMVVGGFLFLCEVHPHAIYQWFSELFIDAYDWVMVPNVYAMSQHADGGLITTKPYFSGSAYLKKMGYNQTGDWTDLWDGLYWRWIWNHREQLRSNPRWAMMCSMAEKMPEPKRERHLTIANDYLKTILRYENTHW